MKVVILFALMLIAFPRQSAAQGVCVISERKLPTASGVVLFPNNIPITNATVVLRENDFAGPIVATTKSDNGGHFSFSGIKAGKYGIETSAPTLVTLHVPIRITLKRVPRNRRVELAIIMNGLIGVPCGGGDVELRECKVR